MRECRSRRGLVALVALNIAAVAAAHGQGTGQGDVRWSLEGNRGSYCISYLIDPELVGRILPSDAKPAPAGSGVELHPFLARTVQDEPRFAQWIPAAICIGYYDRVTSDGKVLAQAHGNRPIIIVTSSVAVQSPRGIAGATSLLLDILTDQRPLQRAGDDVGLDIGGITVTSRVRVEGSDPDVQIDVDGVTFHWSGHATGASSVGKTRSVSFGYAGRRSDNYLLTSETTPETSRLMVGALGVVGTNSLAKALRASPVRAVGPEEVGGTTFWTLHKKTKQ